MLGVSRGIELIFFSYRRCTLRQHEGLGRCVENLVDDIDAAKKAKRALLVYYEMRKADLDKSYIPDRIYPDLD